MELIKFKRGIDHINYVDTVEDDTKNTVKIPFIPLGHSIVKHTDTLFLPKNSNSKKLVQLIESDDDESLDPGSFQALTYSTMKAIEALMATKDEEPDSETNEVYKQATAVIRSLSDDQNLLNDYWRALTSV
jgi:hypothetical protein